MSRPDRAMHARRLAYLLALVAWLVSAAATSAAGSTVVVLPATGIVDGGMATYLRDRIANAESGGAAAVVIKLDTPGGSLSATQEIVETILDARVPVIVWVAPSGGYAASAGTFITMASNLAFMAPGTRIGAASPVGGQGEDIAGTMGEKVRNDAVAWMTSIVQHRHRPIEWAVSTVRDASSYSATDAKVAGAVDGLASTLDEVLAIATGRTVQTAAGTVTLDLAGAMPTEEAMSPFLSFIRLLSDPTIAFLLLSAGSAGLLAELWSPNFVTGILGAMALILAFIGLGSLPLNVGGLLLILLGLVLFGLELTVTSHGLLGFGGLVCFALGASALFVTPVDPFEPIVRVALPVIAVTVATGGALMVVIVLGVISSRRLGSGSAGAATVVAGAPAIVRRPLEPVGSVHAAGEEWTARSADGAPIERGAAVRVVGTDGLTLIVASAGATSTPSSSPAASAPVPPVPPVPPSPSPEEPWTAS